MGVEQISEDIARYERPGFRKELETIINRYSKENGSNTPDFILAQFLEGCLAAFDGAVSARTAWYTGKLAEAPPDKSE